MAGLWTRVTIARAEVAADSVLLSFICCVSFRWCFGLFVVSRRGRKGRRAGEGELAGDVDNSFRRDRKFVRRVLGGARNTRKARERGGCFLAAESAEVAESWGIVMSGEWRGMSSIVSTHHQLQTTNHSPASLSPLRPLRQKKTAAKNSAFSAHSAGDFKRESDRFHAERRGAGAEF